MKRKYGFVAVLLGVILLAGMGFTTVYTHSREKGEDDSVRVVTSFYPMYIAALNVIGETKGVSLENLSEPQTGCLHDYQLTPEDMKRLSSADVFIVNGGGIESFLAEVAESYPGLVIINASEGLELLEGEEHVHGEETDIHEEEPSHEEQNAHAWMSVKAYMQQIETIAEGLLAADEEHGLEYRENAAAYLKELRPLARELEELKQELGGGELISFHEAYAYVAEDLGLDVAFTLNLDEERQVSAGEVAEVIGLIRGKDIRVVLAEERYGADLGNTVSKETDARVVYLNTLVSGVYEKDSYKDGMEENIRLLKEAFTR